MCGLAGLYSNTGISRVDVELFRNSVRLMAHRGPDNFGEQRLNNTYLSHYRLSILDLSTTSNQPFQKLDVNNTLVFNGEIYNYKDLKSKYKLETETNSDTEVLYDLLSEYGLSVLSELNGIFAFAFLDNKHNKLYLVRDRLGVKPLYYSIQNGQIVFASEAKVIYNFMDELSINWNVLHEFLYFGSSTTEETLVNGVKKLEAGMVLEIDTNTSEYNFFEYYNLSKYVNRGEVVTTYKEAKNTTRDLLEKAVERQCISDVSVGAYLSGGIDSSVVVALAAQNMGKNLNTYSVSFDESNNSELPLARKVAEKFGTNHHELVISSKKFEDDITKIVFQYDEPFADPAMIPLHLMAQQNKYSSTVVLQGDGGDELFAGYGRHLDSSDLFKRRIGASLLSKINWDSKNKEVMRKRAFILNTSESWKRMARFVSGYITVDPRAIFTETFRSELDNTDPFRMYKRIDSEISTKSDMQRMLYTDMQIVLPNTFLEKVDKISMLHSIEARVPFLDNDLVDYVMRLPAKYKIKGGITKSLLRDVMSDTIPHEILYGKKQSFGTPINNWLATSLFDYAMELFESKRNSSIKIFDVDFLIQLLKNNKENKGADRGLLWRSIVLIIWMDIYMSKIKF